MTEQRESRTFEVESEEAAALLSDVESLRFLAPFLGHERTLSGVAAELGAPISTVYRRVQRFVALGLAQVTKESARKGRALKHYRCVADAFFVPVQLAPHAVADGA